MEREGLCCKHYSLQFTVPVDRVFLSLPLPLVLVSISSPLDRGVSSLISKGNSLPLSRDYSDF